MEENSLPKKEGNEKTQKDLLWRRGFEQYLEKKNKDKPLPFPSKTKNAAWWMIIFGGLLSIICLIFMILTIGGCGGSCDFVFLIPLLLFIPICIIFFLGFSVLNRKKWAWWLNTLVLLVMIFVSIFLIFSSISTYNFAMEHSGGFYLTERRALKELIIELSLSIILFSFFFIPLMLLFIDRKNFFKIAS